MKPILFYDGDCHFCNFWVRWILERDLSGRFEFSAIESDFSNRLFRYFGYEVPSGTLIVLTPEGAFLTKSVAVSYIFTQLQIQSVLSGVLRMLPSSVADKGYHIIAAVRRKIPVKSCSIFTDEEKARFLAKKGFSEWISENKHLKKNVSFSLNHKK